MSTKVNIENCAARGERGIKDWLLGELVTNLKELRERTDKGDMAALAEFFEVFRFNDNERDDRRGPDGKLVAPAPATQRVAEVMIYYEMRDRQALEQALRRVGMV